MIFHLHCTVREEEVTEEGDYDGLSGDHRLRCLLGAILDLSDHHAVPCFFSQLDKGHLSGHHDPQLLQQRSQSCSLRFPQRKLPQDFRQGVPVRKRGGSESITTSGTRQGRWRDERAEQGRWKRRRCGLYRKWWSEAEEEERTGKGDVDRDRK